MSPDESMDVQEQIECLNSALWLQHRLEHMIMRKQEQVDYLLRARRRL